MAVFNLIEADPPWPEASTIGTKRHGADRHFQTMTEREILRLPVHQVSDPASTLLFLWTTARHIPMACRVMEKWGFQYITVAFTWIKVSKKTGDPIYTLGYYTQPNPEFCLLGRMGSAREPVDRAIKSVFYSIEPDPDVEFAEEIVEEPRAEKFAEKPLEFHGRIDRMYPSADKLQIFGRVATPEWTVVGNEVDGLDVVDALERLRDAPIDSH